MCQRSRWSKAQRATPTPTATPATGDSSEAATEDSSDEPAAAAASPSDQPATPARPSTSTRPATSSSPTESSAPAPALTDSEATRSDSFQERIEVIEVQLDVVVKDNGKQVTGLGPDDFVVTEEGKPVEVTSAVFYGAPEQLEAERHSRRSLQVQRQ